MTLSRFPFAALVRAAALLVALPCCLSACLGTPPAGSGGSNGGGGTSGSGGSSGSGGAKSCNMGAAGGGSATATFSGIKTIITFYCGGAGCHNDSQAPNFFPGNDAALYKTLTEYTVTKCGGRVLVKPCAPEESAFYRAQSETTTCDPLPRMPFGCGQGSCTAPDDLEDVRQWIAKGAPKD